MSGKREFKVKQRFGMVNAGRQWIVIETVDQDNGAVSLETHHSFKDEGAAHAYIAEQEGEGEPESS